MRRSSNLKKTSLSAIEPGELIRYNFGTGASLMMLLRTSDSRSEGLFGVLSSPVFERPMSSHIMRLDEDCLTYGRDWFLEEMHGPETAVEGYNLNRDSALMLDAKGLILLFRPEKNRFSEGPVLFNVSTNLVVGSLDRRAAAPISQWRIWESEEHFSDGRNMLFEMNPKADD
jgi:hypothetical protein